MKKHIESNSTQIVSYSADEHGYVADVKYEGDVHYDPAPHKGPVHHAAPHKAAPIHHAPIHHEPAYKASDLLNIYILYLSSC